MEAKRIKYSDDSISLYDELCSHFTIKFGSVAGNLDSVVTSDNEGFPVPFIHQFFENPETALSLFQNIKIKIFVDPKSFFTFFHGLDDKGDRIQETDLKRLLLPIHSRFQESSFFFNFQEFKKTCSGYIGQKNLGDVSHFLHKAEKYSLISFPGNSPTNLDLVSRIQKLLPFYIDGSSEIDFTDVRWDLYTLYNSKKELTAFCSAYRFLKFPDRVRLRISQFFVLPLCQRHGIGSCLYKHIFEKAAKDESIDEITVEDPSEKFNDFRLFNDFSLYHQLGNDLKLTKSQKKDVLLLDQYIKHHKEENSPDFLSFLNNLNRYLLHLFNGILPKDQEMRKKALEQFAQDKLEQYRRLLRIT